MSEEVKRNFLDFNTIEAVKEKSEESMQAFQFWLIHINQIGAEFCQNMPYMHSYWFCWKKFLNCYLPAMSTKATFETRHIR